MTKSRDSNREGKKKPATTMKEKRAARKAKKETKGLLGSAGGVRISPVPDMPLERRTLVDEKVRKGHRR